jgi:hypothetical protein
MGVQASSLMAAIAARMLVFTGTVTENRAPPRRIALITLALQNAEPIRTTIVAVQPQSRAVVMDRAARLAAPRADPAFPPRSRVAAITGADSGVLIVAASAFRPLTSSDFPAILVWPNLAPCDLSGQKTERKQIRASIAS